MKNLPYRLTETQRRLLGLIVLQTDETVESDCRQLFSANPTVNLLHTRIAVNDIVSVDNLVAMKTHLTEALALFPEGKAFDAIGYACTSAAAVIGEAEVERLIKNAVNTAFVTNPLTAAKAALAHLQAKRIAYLSPYTENISLMMCQALTTSGLEIVAAGTFNQHSDKKVAAIDAPSICRAVEELTRKTAVDVVFISCTNLQCMDVIQFCQKQFKTTVLSSNLVLIWHLAKLSGSTLPKLCQF
ncbi:Asp/Glu racemase [Candidatus Persebacteraceae bacterium Df01]|uniref:Asp/Glu racemase n=1 Tax=Candidatus Doriopsillibacter californiensis TaxID=2970740 RepID=A0ABT7QKB6_9GAMM|nr:Asp/Glu racemase [Candidatus Persebacteraceae bacterium Df01]